MRRNSINVAGPAVKPKVKILRRNAILELVLAQPSDRYKALRHFIDIACVEQSEVMPERTGLALEYGIILPPSLIMLPLRPDSEDHRDRIFRGAPSYHHPSG
jgi:hypothetical protein